MELIFERCCRWAEDLEKVPFEVYPYADRDLGSVGSICARLLDSINREPEPDLPPADFELGFIDRIEAVDLERIALGLDYE